MYKEYSDPAYMTAHDIATQVKALPSEKVAVSLTTLTSLPVYASIFNLNIRFNLGKALFLLEQRFKEILSF
jgi:hypothetical protein